MTKMNSFVVIFVLTLTTCLGLVIAEDAKISNTKNLDENKFIPTNEWQVIPEGQQIPPGLHVRIDMQTGKKEAKLLDETEEKSQVSALTNVPTEDQKENTGEKPAEKPGINYPELKEALKKIKSDAKEGVREPSSTFRSYEDIKEELKKIEQSIKTEYEILKELVTNYATQQGDSEKEQILNDLEFYVHQYDNAQDFVKMGGLKDVVLPALNSTNKELRSSAAFLLGSACQSNPKTQIAALESGSLPHLIRLVTFDPNSDVRNRALYAISSLIRNFPIAQKALVQQGGMTSFAEIFQTDSSDLVKLQLKIVTLLSDVILEKDMASENLQEILKDDASMSNNATERDMFIEKLRQYEAANVEKSLVEQGFCRLVPRLLTKLRKEDKQTRREDLSSVQGRPFREEHDVVEKVVQAMLILTRSCRNEFQSVRGLIRSLGERYHVLSNQEQADASSKSLEDHDSIDMYFSKIHGMCQQLWNELQRDEL